MMNKLLSFVFACSLVLPLAAQQHTDAREGSSAEVVFGKFADSTLILKTENTWFHGVDALIISKTAGMVSCFSYHLDIRDMVKPGVYLPPALGHVFFSRAYGDYDKGVAFNPYLRVLFIHPDSARNIWKQVAALAPWSMRDDAADGYGCPVDPSSNTAHNTFDANEYKLQLITKSETKQLDFYAPDFYVRYCPGRDGRKRFLALQAIFGKYLGKQRVVPAATAETN